MSPTGARNPSTLSTHDGQKGNEVTELVEITNGGRNRKGMRNDERLGGEIGRRAKGDQRRIKKESDWRQKRGETKGRMLAF